MATRRTSRAHKKSPRPKVTTKKTPGKKTPAKKTPGKKTPAKKTPAKTTKRTAEKKSPAVVPQQKETAPWLRQKTKHLQPIGAEKDDDAEEAEWDPLWGSDDERRKFQRIPREMKVRLFAGQSDAGYLEAHLESIDLSLSGIFLRSTFFLTEGTPVRVEIEGSQGVASARGKVVRVQREGDGSGFGIHFSKLDASAMEDLVRIFVGERIQRFVTAFAHRHGARTDQKVLLDAILAWEMLRLNSALDTTSS